MQVNPVINIDRLHNSTLGTINTMVHDAEMNSRNQERRTHVPLANNTLPSPGRAVIHHTSTSSIPTRLHIPPSPPFNPNLNISNQYHQRQGQLPTVPNLYIGAVPGSPIPVVSDIGQDSTIFSTSSPYLRATKSAVDHAIANERDRISNLEQQEVNYTTIEEFKIALKKERQHSKHLVTDLAALKSIAVASTLEAEVNEEGRINCLMRRLDGLQKEKGRIIVELEREEEMVSFVESLFSHFVYSKVSRILFTISLLRLNLYIHEIARSLPIPCRRNSTKSGKKKNPLNIRSKENTC
jgi:hypothetical protein